MMKIPSTGELCSRCATGGFGHCSRNKCIHNSGIKSLLGTVEATLYKKIGHLSENGYGYLSQPLYGAGAFRESGFGREDGCSA